MCRASAPRTPRPLPDLSPVWSLFSPSAFGSYSFFVADACDFSLVVHLLTSDVRSRCGSYLLAGLRRWPKAPQGHGDVVGAVPPPAARPGEDGVHEAGRAPGSA